MERLVSSGQAFKIFKEIFHLQVLSVIKFNQVLLTELTEPFSFEATIAPLRLDGRGRDGDGTGRDGTGEDRYRTTRRHT